MADFNVVVKRITLEWYASTKLTEFLKISFKSFSFTIVINIFL